MSRLRTALVMATVLSTAAIPAVANTPKGMGLFPHHADSCTDSSGQPIADTDMLLSSGTSFWMGGVHYAVQRVEYSGAYTGTYTYGVKAGLGDPITCDGDFVDPAIGTYHVHSTDVPIK